MEIRIIRRQKKEIRIGSENHKFSFFFFFFYHSSLLKISLRFHVLIFSSRNFDEYFSK